MCTYFIMCTFLYFDIYKDKIIIIPRTIEYYLYLKKNQILYIETKLYIQIAPAFQS